MQATDLHLVSWNRPKMTELVIRTIHRNTNPENFRLVVWDNGSDERVQDMLMIMHNNGLIDELISSDTNEGLEWARHQLLLNTKSEYFVCVDNDCLPQPISGGSDWLEKLVDLMQKYEEYAAVACRTQIMIGTGNIFEDESKDITDFPHPGGSLRIMNTSVVKDVGGWERGAEGRGAEERYICGKLRDAGYKTGFATHIKTLHLFGTTDTDNWGYDKTLKPQDTGHSPDVWHPVFDSGDDFDQVKEYAGEENAQRYFA